MCAKACKSVSEHPLVPAKTAAGESAVAGRASKAGVFTWFAWRVRGGQPTFLLVPHARNVAEYSSICMWAI
jgi:hypothetical protein